MKKIFTLAFILCIVVSTTSYGQFKILKDANPGIFEGAGGPNASWATYNGKVYFTGTIYNSEFGTESPNGLWKTDGTDAGTERVKLVKWVSDLTNANGTLFFTASVDGSQVSRRVLWKTDGTDAGTVIVKDQKIGTDNAVPSINKDLLTTVNNKVYFIANSQLWVSDGTEAGTVMVKNILPIEMENVGGTLFFSSATGLWKSDGTDAGTVQVSATTASGIRDLNGVAVFRGNAGLATDGFWKSDGTAAGTIQLTSAVPGTINIVNGKALFQSGPSNIWASDGTVAGTSSIFTISTPGQSFVQMIGSGNISYFAMQTDPGGLRELWKTDGTAAGTVKIKDLLANSVQGFRVIVNGKLLFTNTDTELGAEIWISDGTSGGTGLVKDIYEGFKGSNTKNFYVSGSTVYFSALDGIHGQELWKTDGTNAGTSLVKDFLISSGSDASNLINLNNSKLIFAAADLVSRAPNPPIGKELWGSDGTTGGTSMIKDIGEGGNISSIANMTAFSNRIFFSANNGFEGNELYQTDGTLANTTKIEINTNLFNGFDRSAFPSWLKVVGSTMFFSATNGPNNNGQELWKTDGTAAGTVMVKDINPGTASSSPSWLTNVNGVLFFAANDGSSTQLWKSDGTEAGTVKLTDHPFGGSPTDLININGTLYYSYNSGTEFGRELFSSDGTPGLNAIKDLKTLGSSNPTSMTNFNGTLFFVANGNNGVELFKSDGTDAGTVMVKDIVSGGGSSNPQSLIVVNGSLYFTADDGVNGRELWKSDGTEAGTVMLKDINFGGSGNPTALTKIGFRLYFAANDGINGNEIWSTDGTTIGTNMVQDIEPGPGSSDPTEFVEVNGKIYTSVINSGFGREVWFAPVPNDSPLPLTLLEFKGSLQNENGVLQWKTENEYNTSTFVIERSTDGRSYKSIGTVNALNASGVNHYDYIDANIKALGASIVYYRLRQTDADNKFTYSRIVALAIDNKQSFAMLYPNPVNSEINLTITLVKKQRLNWQLVGSNGHIVRSGSFNLSAGSTTTAIDASQLSKGNYILLLNGESLQQTIKVIKQ